MNEIKIEYQVNLPFFVFAIQNIALLCLSIYMMYYLMMIKLYDTNNFEIFHYFVLLIFLVVAFKTLSFIKELYRLKKITMTDSTIIVNDKQYDIDEVSFRVPDVGYRRGSLIYGELYMKEDGTTLVTLFFTFWAGSLLSITPYTFDNIFNDNIEKRDGKEVVRQINTVDVEREHQDVKNSDLMYFGLLLMFVIPVVVFSLIK